MRPLTKDQLISMFVVITLLAMCAGKRLKAEDVYPAVEMFAELLSESSQFKSHGGEPVASVGDFIRAEVHLYL